VLASGAAVGDASGPLPMGGSAASGYDGPAGVGEVIGTTRVIGSGSCADAPVHAVPESTARVQRKGRIGLGSFIKR
jgi:hypothetical protein